MLPPSMEELKRRISGRGTEKAPDIEKRINRAVSELRYVKKYDYIFFNDSVDGSVENVLTILKAEKMKQSRNDDILDKIMI